MNIDINLWLQDAIINKLCEKIKKDLKKRYPLSKYINVALDSAPEDWLYLRWQVNLGGQEQEFGTEVFEIREALEIFLHD